MAHMEWSDLRVFLAVARAGTLGGAARLLGQTQPTMGRRLRTLEQAVGHTLFQRGNDGFVLTDEGAAVLAHAERIEEEAIALERQLAGQGRQLSGMLRVSSSDWFGAHVLTPIFSAFTRIHPQVTIELVTDQRLYSLARREADMVFRIRPFDEPDVIQRKLLHMDYALYAAAPDINVTAGDGAGLALVTMDSAFADLPDAVWLRRLLPQARIAYRSNNRDVQAQACRAGAGLAVLPRLLGDRFPGLHRLDLIEGPPGLDVWVGYHRDLRQLTRLRALLDATLAALSN
ncbi:MAG TPA: LysR family transcriptional regulator [Dongiaceae bacterium]|nr:LysR family transcriptional regulator [Dongiaceae bacterium]